MDRSKVILLIYTLKYLKLKQIYYQFFYKIRGVFFKNKYSKFLAQKGNTLNWKDSFSYPNSFSEEGIFVFVNQVYECKDSIDWNFKKYGKLWTYNLNYFDFLNQENITKEQGLVLIQNYLSQDSILKDGKEPYPISLRGINWIKFLSKHKIADHHIDQTLYNHYQILTNNLEYHLLGNHLLENGYSLLFGAYYFKDERFYKKAKNILTEELKEQILEDGAHFELSPMYHQILLHRLLDCINLINLNSWKEKEDFVEHLKVKAISMLGWLNEITFRNGTIPMVNDSTYDIAPSSKQLFTYAEKIGLQLDSVKLSDSGYRMIRKSNYELFVDVGDIGPSYQPGHAHSDTFNFELYIENKPFIVDTGISTYEKNSIRLEQRQTASHNTVKIDDKEQSEVWDGFRVARRAKIVQLKEKQNYIEATHNGYKKLNLLHKRIFITEDSKIEIIDEIPNGKKSKKIAFLHIHPEIGDFKISGNNVNFSKGSFNIQFKGDSLNIEISDYDYCLGFNRTRKAKKIAVMFENNLSTQINL